MPAPTEKDDVVVPLRLQPVVDRPAGWRGRSVTFLAVGLAGFLVTALVLGRTLDTGTTRPPAAEALASAAPPGTHRPTPRPTPTPEPTPSPLPTLEVIGGQIPTERRLVYANGVQLLDLATGTLQPTTQPLYDAMYSIGDDQVACACSLGGIFGSDPTVPPSLRFGRYRLDGTVILERELLAFDDVVPVPDMTSGVNVATAMGPDRTTMFALVTARRPPSWWIDLYEIRVASGRIVGHASLGRLPVDVDNGTQASPSPSGGPAFGGQPADGIYAWPNGLAVAPDGATAYASISYQEVQAGVWLNHNREWMISIHAGRPGEATRIGSADVLRPGDWCLGTPRFIDADLLVQACAAIGTNGVPTAWYVHRLSADGTSPGALSLEGFPAGQQYSVAAVVDVEKRMLFTWDPIQYILGRIDLDTGEGGVTKVPLEAIPGGTVTGTPGWFGADPGMVESPDGTRLYALGLLPSDGRQGRSTGIWVFDTRTLNWLDHWTPRALLTSLAVSADGAFVYAAGAPGADADGDVRPWPASITVYDAMSGEVQVLYGSVSADSWITFPSWQ